METKCKQERLEYVKCKLGFSNCFVVKLVERKWGITMMWHSVKEVEIVNYSNYHIHSKIQGSETNASGLFTRFYSMLDISK